MAARGDRSKLRFASDSADANSNLRRSLNAPADTMPRVVYSVTAATAPCNLLHLFKVKHSSVATTLESEMNRPFLQLLQKMLGASVASVTVDEQRHEKMQVVI